MTISWQQIMDAAKALRHDLHCRPELTGREIETAAAIRAALSRAGIEWRACAETGTVGMLAKEASGPAVALRADMDALPIEEQTPAPWASKNPGCMHACGHDGHVATLMAAGIWLKQQESQLPGPVMLIFQPAEEGGHGACRMIEDGALAGVDVIYAWHNWPAIPFGQAVCPDGPVMAANGTFKITVTGEGGHASQPELCRDPIAGAAAIVLALQQIVSRRLPPQAAAVVSVTCFEAPGSETVIPMQAVLAGNIRISEDGLRNRVNDLIGQIARDTASAWGVRADVEIFPRYGATINHPAAAQTLRDALAVEFGSRWECPATPVPVMASEDFHYYLNEIPGAMALIGAGGTALHHPCYDFNDGLIDPAARVLVRLAGGPAPEK